MSAFWHGDNIFFAENREGGFMADPAVGNLDREPITMVPEKNRSLPVIILAVLLALAIMFIAFLAMNNINGQKKASKDMATKQVELTTLQAENESLKKSLAEKPVPPPPSPIPEGMELVSKDQIKIWEGCCAREVQRKTQAAVEKPQKKVAKKTTPKPAIVAPATTAIVISTPKSAQAYVAPSAPVFMTPKGECFELGLPQGNQ